MCRLRFPGGSHVAADLGQARPLDEFQHIFVMRRRRDGRDLDPRRHSERTGRCSPSELILTHWPKQARLGSARRSVSLWVLGNQSDSLLRRTPIAQNRWPVYSRGQYEAASVAIAAGSLPFRHKAMRHCDTGAIAQSRVADEPRETEACCMYSGRELLSEQPRRTALRIRARCMALPWEVFRCTYLTTRNGKADRPFGM